MNVLVARLALLLWACVAGSAASAQTVERRPLPPLMRTVSDEAGVLSVDEGRKLARELEAILDEDGIRVVLVIAESVQPETIEDYAQRLAQRWARDRGIDPARAIFMIVALNDRELVVMPGRDLGLETALAGPDLTAGLPPLFRERRYYDALIALTERVHGVIHQQAALRPPRKR